MYLDPHLSGFQVTQTVWGSERRAAKAEAKTINNSQEGTTLPVREKLWVVILAYAVFSESESPWGSTY